MKENPVGWFEIYVQDLERAQAFYEQVLGTTLAPLGSPSPELEMLAFPMDFTLTGSPGALVKMEGKSSGPGGTLIYFSCEDCAVEAGRAAANGGSVLREKMSIGEYGFIALAHDPDGNVIGLHSMS